MAQNYVEEINKQIFEQQKELLVHSYSQAMAYTNMIMIGGYAGFFGLWSLTKEYLLPAQVYLSALLIAVSIITFVFFEIYKMILIGRVNEGIQEAVDNPNKFIELMAAHKQKIAEMMLLHGRVWKVVLIVAVSTGFGAAATLLYSFISGLLRI